MKNKELAIPVLNLINRIQSLASPLELALIFAVLTFAFHQSTTAQKNDSSIKIMTFNIRYGLANDGENSWQFRREKVFDVIKNSKPDLIGLQEALDFQNEEILKQFPQYGFIGAGRDDGKNAGEFSSILYRKKRFSVDTTETFWFSETPTIPGSKHWGNNITRVCSWALFKDKMTGKKLYHYNLHIDHESQPSREKSTALLVKKMQSQKKQFPIILTGDFNSGETNQAVINILNSGLTDSYRMLHPKTENEGTFNSFKGETNGEKIDFIFISKELKCKESEIIRTNYEGKYPSDHFPVKATLLLN